MDGTPRRTALLTLLAASAAGCASSAPGEASREASVAFLRAFEPLAGQVVPGEVDEARTPTNPFAGQPLALRVLEASERGAWIALDVGEDRTRTWVLTVEKDGRLRLRHDHRDGDGTPHDLTDYGGPAAPGGTATRQVFPADGFTAHLLPEAATNVWTLSFEEDGGLFVYDLTRHGLPRFRATFELPWRSSSR